MWKIFFIVISTSIFLLSNSFSIAYEREIKSLSSAMSENIARAGKKTIAVVDFIDLQGNVTELGRFLAEEFSVALSGTEKGFEVVERTQLKAILKEHKLVLTGIIDPSTAKKLGQIVGVDALITGTITPFGDTVRVAAKVLDTASGKVIAASSGDIAKTKAIEELLARGIETSQSFRQEPSAPSYAPSSKSKKVGDMVVTMKKIVIAKNQLMVALDFFNQSDKEFRLARGGEEPQLVDEKGNIFKYIGQITSVRFFGSIRGKTQWGESGLTLYAKSNNDVVLHFGPKDSMDVKELGSIFALSFNYALYNPKDKSESSYIISFTDIMALKAK